MRVLRWLSLGLAISCAVLLAMALVAVPLLSSRAVLAQRVRVPKSEMAAIFGDEPTPVGSPQMPIITDEQAFLPRTGEGGVRLVDEGYLERSGTYPLQLKTVQFVASIVTWVSAAGAIVFGLAAIATGRRTRPRPSVEANR